MNRQRPMGSSVKEAVYNAAWELTGGDTKVIFTNREVKDFIARQNPDFKMSNVECELRADCVNNTERDRQYPDRINYDYYWWAHADNTASTILRQILTLRVR